MSLSSSSGEEIQSELLVGRPHAADAIEARAGTLAPLYPQMADFRRLRSRLDPRSVFVNDWLIDQVLGQDPTPSG